MGYYSNMDIRLQALGLTQDDAEYWEQAERWEREDCSSELGLANCSRCPEDKKGCAVAETYRQGKKMAGKRV